MDHTVLQLEHQKTRKNRNKGPKSDTFFDIFDKTKKKNWL